MEALNKLSEAQIVQNDDIETDAIKQDIFDTEYEVAQLENELTVLTKNPTGNKLSIYMKNGHLSQIKEFIAQLQQIIEYRQNNPHKYNLKQKANEASTIQPNS